MPFWDRTREIPLGARIATVLWLSFLLAVVATGVFFAAIDPMELRYCVDFPEIGRLGAYTVGFFLFWLLSAASGLLSVFFTYPSRNGASAERPED